jgi:phosphate transport system permease protein
MDKHHKRALFFDKLSRVVIYFGGIVTIVSVIAILFFIFSEALPLWYGAESEKSKELNFQKQHSDKPILIGIDEYKEILFTITEKGRVDFINLKTDSIIKSVQLEEIKDEIVTSFSKTLSNNFIGLGTNKGKAYLLQINFKTEFSEEGTRTISPDLKFINLVQIDSLNYPLTKLSFRLKDENNYTIVALNSNNNLFLYSFSLSSDFSEESQTKVSYYRLDKFVDSKITAIELDNFCEKLMIGTFDGKLIYLSVKDDNQPELIQSILPFNQKNSPITSLGFVLGDQSVIVGNSEGQLASFMRILDESTDYGWKLINPHIFQSHKNSVTNFTASSRNKTFITGDQAGISYLHHLTSERTLLEFSGSNASIKDISYSPKSDAVAILYDDLRIAIYEIDNKHPETTVKTLFGKVWYEGYSEPAFVWQSTGGTDDFEPKFSLIPLIFGTFKGTLYAMLFAIPLALMGALYTSQFSHPSLRNFIKPTVEIMAALPSVVIGFIAGLWLAPLLEKIFVGVMLVFIIIPIMIFLGLYLWNLIPSRYTSQLKPGAELVVIIPLIIFGFIIAQWLGPLVELYLLGGDYRLWISEFFNQQYDQRNSIVVGFAMGFAVIPIIFTICEDALSSVPSSLTSASLALGATKWQTATRIVLPTASPGIFSAVMIGLGRAIGETMIVLMATGNTPILSLSPFNGMRTLSANIAVEIPEAPYGGTLYRILFLSATILFIFTFIINTVAEVVRQRLRKKYAEL